MLAGLAVIVVVLNGLKIAFSGNIQPWELVRVIIGLWIPWVMLQFYTTTIPGMAFTFPGMIAAGGNWLHNLLIGDTIYSMQTELGNLVRSLVANMETQAQQGNTFGLLTGGIHAAITAVIGTVMFLFVVLMLLLLAAVTYAQVIWAQIALAILIILGPIFIPFLVFEPLSFLFWGWFRGMITYSLYAVIAGAVLRVVLRRGNLLHHELGECQPRHAEPHGRGLVDARRCALVRCRDAGKPQVRGAGLDARHEHGSRGGEDRSRRD